MNPKKLLLISTAAIPCALLFFAWQKKWIILNFCPATSAQTTNKKMLKKECTLYYWRHNKWHEETNNLIWSNNTALNMHYLINSWLTLLFDEELSKRMHAHILFCPSGILYVSFDRSPFGKHISTHEKLIFIESLLKTVKANSTIGHLYFLIQHKPLLDTHLDFSSTWPVDGYIS